MLDAAGWRLGDPDPLGTAIPDDVMSRLLMGEREGELSRREVERLGHQLMVAGHETTASLIGTMLWRLAQLPEVLAALRADPSLVEVAVEEALRYESPAQGLFRTNAEDAEVGGVMIPSGTKLQVLFASANRDPQRWDHPDDFRLDRDPEDLRRHVAFGFGVHFCIGAPVARLATKVAIGEFLARTTSYDQTGEAVRNEPFILRGLTNLPLRWTVS
jgi:cytochrome P450